MSASYDTCQLFVRYCVMNRTEHFRTLTKPTLLRLETTHIQILLYAKQFNETTPTPPNPHLLLPPRLLTTRPRTLVTYGKTILVWLTHPNYRDKNFEISDYYLIHSRIMLANKPKHMLWKARRHVPMEIRLPIYFESGILPRLLKTRQNITKTCLNGQHRLSSSG